jgi:hypothetical protein
LLFCCSIGKSIRKLAEKKIRLNNKTSKEMAEPEPEGTDEKVKKEEEKNLFSLNIPFNNNRRRGQLSSVLHVTLNTLF